MSWGVCIIADECEVAGFLAWVDVYLVLHFRHIPVVLSIVDSEECFCTICSALSEGNSKGAIRVAASAEIPSPTDIDIDISKNPTSAVMLRIY